MPKRIQDQLKKAKYVSMADYYQKVDQIENFDEKLEFTTYYLLSHGMNGQPTDYSFEESIHLARLKLIDTSKQLRDRLNNDENGPDPADLYIDEHPEVVNPYAEDYKDDIENEFFMGKPAEYLKAKANKYINEIEDEEMEVGDQRSFRQNCQRLSNTLTPAMTHNILVNEDKGTPVLDIQARLEAKYCGRDNLRTIQNNIKPGFFTRMFGTRSNAGKNFDEVYAAFHNPKHALYGNTNALEKATTEYLAYKDANKSAAERAVGLALKEPKEAFCGQLLEAIREQKANNEIFKPVVGGCVRKNLTEEAVNEVKGPEVEEDNPHRQHIVLDLDDDENSLDESMESENELDMSMESENELEEDAASM